jgi:hypothetical protein
MNPWNVWKEGQMSEKRLKLCKNHGMCAMAGCPIWTEQRRCRLCERKLKNIQLNDRDYKNLEMRAIEDNDFMGWNRSNDNAKGNSSRDDRSTKNISAHPQTNDYHGHSQTGYRGFQPALKPSDEFTCADTFVKGCPLVSNDNKPTVLLEYDTYKRWTLLAAKFATEWLMYLHGTFDAEINEWTITGEYVPKQRVNTAHVDVLPGQIKPDTIGDVHSHNTMSAFFSAEDEKHFNWPVHLVINGRGDIKANIEITLECGRKARTEASVKWFIPDNSALDKACKVIREAIQPEVLNRIPASTEPAAAPTTTATTTATGSVADATGTSTVN